MSDVNGKKRVAVGMSGGIDSSAAAALLLDQGHEVIGLTAHMWKGSRCCSLEDVERAATVCRHLGIRHEMVNAVEEFGHDIIEPFVRDYAEGRTPSPCVTCNERIKFGLCLDHARKLGFEYFATGHYARIENRSGIYHMLRGDDPDKDQTYFLHRLSQEQLAHVIFPLAGMLKPQVIDYVKARGIPAIFRGESQDLCFVPDDGHGAMIERYRKDLKQRGDIVNRAGRVLGVHEGFYNYTIGQRKGLGVAWTEPLYVSEVRPGRNEVVLGPRSEVMHDACRLCDVCWMTGIPVSPLLCDVQIRYRHHAVPAKVCFEDQRAVVRFSEPQFAITPGQAAVFYSDTEVLGGGWIEAVL
ncbi:MAG: tRNA 2-thiouridine(34) synthase MnmA [Kiritimatiellia bacterium]